MKLWIAYMIVPELSEIRFEPSGQYPVVLLVKAD